MKKIDLINAILGRMKERYAGYAWDITESDEVLGDTLIEMKYELQCMVDDWHANKLNLKDLDLSSEKVSESPPLVKSEIPEIRMADLYQEFWDTVGDAINNWGVVTFHKGMKLTLGQWDFDENCEFGDEIEVTKEGVLCALVDMSNGTMQVSPEHKVQAYLCLYGKDDLRMEIDAEMASLICQHAMFGEQEFSI